MTNIFITKRAVKYPLSGVVDGSWNIDKLVKNQLALFNDDGSIISDSTSMTNVTLANITGDNIRIGYMNADGITRFSTSIPIKGFKYGKTGYSAEVLPVKVLGGEKATTSSTYKLNLPATIKVGDLVGVTLIDKSKEFYDNSRVKEYSFTVVGGDSLTGTGTSNIISKLVGLINADSNSVAIAVANNDGTNNTGIKLTAKLNDFEIANVDGVLKNADIVEYKIVNGIYSPSSTTTVVAYDSGHGIAANVAKSESDTLPYLGKQTGKVLQKELWTSSSNVVKDETYISYMIPFSQPTDVQVSIDANLKQLIGVNVPNESTTIGSNLTSGTLSVGKTYRIVTFVAGDDFSNVGGTNATGDVFVATGTTPTTWTNSSTLIQVNAATIEYALDKVFSLIS